MPKTAQNTLPGWTILLVYLFTHFQVLWGFHGGPTGPYLPQNSPFRSFKDLTMVWKVKREFKTPPNTYLGWLHLLACFHNSLAFPEMSKRAILTSKRPPQGCFLTFSPTAWFNMSWNCLKSSENSVATIWTPHMPMLQSKPISTKTGALWKGLGPKNPFWALVVGKGIQYVQLST